MPSNPPRTDTTKKREQLQRRRQELKHAIRSAFSREKLVRAADHLKEAHLSLLKAELHWETEAKIKGHGINERVFKIQENIRSWMEKSTDDILNELGAMED